MITPSLLNKPHYMLLEITVAGQHLYFADQTVTVPSDDGDILFSGMALLDTPQISLPAPGQISEPNSISVSVFAREIHTLLSRGVDFSTGTGEISFLFEGQTYEQRTTILYGYLNQPDRDRPTDYITLTIQEEAWDESALTHENTWRFNKATTGSDSFGGDYPMVFGSPNVYYKDGATQNVVGSKGYISSINADFFGYALVLSYGHVVADQASFYDDDGAYWPCTILKYKDALGQPVSLIDIDDQAGGAAITALNEEGYSVLWDFGKGLPSYLRSDGVYSIADLAYFCFDRTKHKKNIASDVSPVANYLVDGYIDQSMPVIEFLQAVSEVFPVCYLRNKEGSYVVPIPFGDQRSRAVDILINPERLSPLELLSKDTFNTIRLDYAFSTSTERYEESLLLRPLASWAAESFNTEHVKLSISEDDASIRGITEKTFQSTFIKSPTVAQMCINYLAHQYATPQYQTSYRVPWSKAGYRLGDVILITDDDFDWDEQQVYITGILYASQSIDIVVRKLI